MTDDEVAEIAWYVLRGRSVGCDSYLIKVPIDEVEKLAELQQYFEKQRVIVDGDISRITIICE